MVFNIFVSNDDDPLRNHGFVRDPRLSGWRMSPLYDVVPRPGLAQERYLHLAVGTQGKLATLDNALTQHTAFALERPEALALIHQVWLVVRQWRVHFETFGVTERLVDQMALAIRELGDVANRTLESEIRRL